VFHVFKAMAGDTLSVSFNASREYRVWIVERPGVTVTDSALASVKQQCESVVRACLAGESLDYGLFAEGDAAWDRSVITLITRSSDAVPVAFNAMPLLDVIQGGERAAVLHLGLVMVDPAERSGGLSWILYGLTCFALFLRQGMRPLWISSVTQVPARRRHGGRNVQQRLPCARADPAILYPPAPCPPDHAPTPRGLWRG